MKHHSSFKLQVWNNNNGARELQCNIIQHSSVCVCVQSGIVKGKKIAIIFIEERVHLLLQQETPREATTIIALLSTHN